MNLTRIWIKAFRLRTLPLALSATILGSFLGYAENRFKWGVFIFGSLTTLFLQILSNLANDYGDAKKGTDNEKRLGPLRVTQSGLVSRQQIRIMIGFFVFLSLVSGSLLIWFGLRGGDFMIYSLFLLLGFSAIFAAIKYTIGKRPYGYVGFGDIMVFIYFGILGVAGTYFLHTQSLHLSILLPASSVGLFSAGVLNLNNLRDHENDAANGKNTLVVRMGVPWAKTYHVILLLTALILAVLYTILHFKSYYQLIFLLPLPLLISDINKVITNTVPIELNAELKKLAVATLLFSLSFGLGLIL
ncbi:MAG: 1,4-dihydroxy-2-naphthoate octaprenyltransferase [Bacteroidetes bacterium]|jgi:1,4-dihydroxy-2-naphthoate octaprenyltransferase|nr:MAG: 1,4-dihydroxy-2-naphthoate octaprenyltransferase [Bacteroidota bacterium]